jgi:outer membrane protein assembly factor BamB
MRTSVIAALLALPAMGDDWGHLGRDDARLRLPGETIASPATLGPGVSVGSPVVGSPVAADGFLVVADVAGNVQAFRESDRVLLWTRSTGGPILSTPLVAQGRVVVPSGDGQLRTYRLADGVPLWSAATAGADQSSPVLSGGTIFMGAGFPNMGAIAVNASTGASVWNAAFDQISVQSPALSGGRLYLGANSGTFYALDATDGSVVWTYATGGTGGPSSPLVDGPSIYLVSDNSFQNVDVDAANWASANWSVALVDPAPPSGALSVEWAASSPAKAGSKVVFSARFTYPFDDDADGYPDRRELREFAFAVDPATKSVAWQVLLAATSVPDLNGIPAHRVCPSPVATGTEVAVASSVDATLKLLSLANGNVQATFALDAPCLASPIVANARITAVTRVGTIYAYEDPSHVQPSAPSGLTPAGVELDATPATLSWTPGAPGSSYVVRIASDGEFLMNWDFEFVVAGTSMPCPSLDEAGKTYVWGVRELDSANAYGPWSSSSFSINLPPDPPSNLTATARHGKVVLNWTASPTGNTTGYVLAYGPTAGAAGPGVNVGKVTTTTVTGLTNGVSYTFVLRAVDSDNDLSTSVSVSSTPVRLITVGGVGFDTLHQAAAAAAAGDTILLGEDTFLLAGVLVLPQGVNLQGINAHVTRIEAAARFVMITASGSSTISLVTLFLGSTGVEATGSEIVVRNCVIRDMSQVGILVSGKADVLNNTIVNNSVAGVHSTGPSTQARNNIVQQNGVGLKGSVASTYNDVSDGYAECSAGNGDLSQLVVFLDPVSGDYRETASQPSLDAGKPGDQFSQEPNPNGNRINLGAFGNTPLAAASSSTPPPSGGLLGCGLTGLEGVLLVLFFRRRR